MKRLIALFCCLSAIILVAAQSVNSDLKVEPKTFDFGTIEESAGVASHTFRLTNTGSQPITILSVRTGCRCVTAQPPREALAPGASASLTVRFDPAGRSGTFHKDLAIISQGKKINRIQIRGSVNPAPSKNKAAYRHDLGGGLFANYSSIDFGRVAAGSHKTVELRYFNDFPVGMKLTFEIESPSEGEALPSDIEVDIPNGSLLAPDQEGTLPITVSVKKSFSGRRTINLVPIANGYRLTPITLAVRSK